MTDPLDQTHPTAAPGEASAHPEVPPQYGVGPFTIREVALGGVWLLAFLVSFFPLTSFYIDGPVAALVGGVNIWLSGIGWVLTIGLPTVAVFLIVLRRLSPLGIRRVGSLGIDQFASVAFSVAAVSWLQTVWDTVAIALETGAWVRSWVIWVELVLVLAGVVLTVLAPFLPVFEQDFQGRPDAPAHRNARPVRAVIARPKPEPVVATADAASYVPPANDQAAWAPADATGPVPYAGDAAATGPVFDTGAYAAADPLAEPVDDTTRVASVETQPAADAAQASSAAQAFWALVPEERDVVDAEGRSLFPVGPTAWALVIEDRGEVFIVRHEDGRIGYLHDVSGVTRG